MSEAVRGALELIKQKDPSTGLFRELGQLAIRAGKYRSAARKKVLHRCRERLLVARAYRALFEADHFPVFETDFAFR
jgi:hypothetical protein